MQELTADAWQIFRPSMNSWLGITINGYVNKKGELVMGRGIALEAKEKFPQLPKLLGDLFMMNKAVKLAPPQIRPTNVLFLTDYHMFTFPVKISWRDDASIDLIRRSCSELQSYLARGDRLGTFTPNDLFILGRPGCGNGRLSWETVKPVMLEFFEKEDRLIITDKKPI